MAGMEINFTRQALDALALPSPGKRLEAYDTKVRGLMIRVTSTGTKTFAVYRRVNGTPKRVKLGTYPDMKIERARRAALAALGKISDGIDPVAVRRAERVRGTTLAAVLEDYLQARRLKPGTVADYRRVMRESFADWQTKEIRKISKDMVEARHRKRGQQSQARADNAMRVLRALFNYAAEKYEDENGNPMIEANPVARLSNTRSWYRVERRKTVIKPHQLADWFRAVLALKAERSTGQADTARDYFLFLLFTGLRRTEGAQLQWTDVDFKSRTFTIQDTKNKEPLTLPLSSFLQELLERRQKSKTCAYVFSSASDGPFKDPRRWIEQVSEAVPFTLHDLRRTFITVAESLDISVYAIKQLVNHKLDRADVTAGYIVADVERLREPMQKITDYLLSAADVKPSAEVIDIFRTK